ncbi:MAG: type 4a pilus biogenesis protein PilO [Actinomycetota bacterium]
MSPRTRLVLSILGVIVVLIVFFFLFLKPRQDELATVREDIEAEETRTVQLRAELARLQDLQANAPQLQAELAKIRGFVPQDDEVPNFIFLVQDAANAAGVDFVQITPELPKPPPEGAALAEIRISIGAGGGYFSIQDFIRRLHALDRAVRIDNLTLTGVEDATTGELTITMTSTARIFFEAPAVATGTADAGSSQPSGTPAPTPTE